MSFVERVQDIVDNLDLGKPIFRVELRSKSVELREDDWHHGLNDDNLLEQMVARNVRRRFDSKAKKYYIDSGDIIENIGSHVIYDIDSVFMACSPFDQPRRTNAYKDFRETVNRNRNNLEFQKAIFDIYEYYHSNTQTDSISSPKNDVHRTNIYHLLCLMEKSYGKKSNN